MKCHSILRWTACLAFCSALAWGQAGTLPEGTPITVRLDQGLSSASAHKGDPVSLSVLEPVRVNGVEVIAPGASVYGEVLKAKKKGHFGHAGQLDFSIEKVQTMAGDWIPLRYTAHREKGQGHGMSTGILTGVLAVAFWPAAPFMLLRHGNDITVPEGRHFNVFTDAPYQLPAPIAAPATGPVAPAPVAAVPAAAITTGTAMVAINSAHPGDEIDLDGGYVGDTPANLKLPAGMHEIEIKHNGRVWERKLNVMAGSSLSIDAKP